MRYLSRSRSSFLVLAIVVAVTSAGCAADVGSSRGSPGGSSKGRPPEPFIRADQEFRQLLPQEVVWQAPRSLPVDRSQRIVLVIGDSNTLKSKITQLVDRAVPRNAGRVRIGTTVRVTLQGDPGDASINPAGAVDGSTGSKVALLWSWFVRPKHPTSTLQLNAHIEVPTSHYNFTTDVPLSIKVYRTAGYTVHQIFTNMLTWIALISALASGAGWMYRRFRKKARTSTDLAAAS